MKSGTIYRITNTANGKLYIGQTVRKLSARWYQHKNDSRRLDHPLYLAMRKYGVDAFIIEAIYTTDNLSLLNIAETYFIKLYLCNNATYGYNCNDGGRGYNPTTETREKLSRAKLGKPLSQAHKDRLSERSYIKGRARDEHVRQKISATHKTKGTRLSDTALKKSTETRQADSWVSPKARPIRCSNGNVYKSARYAAKKLGGHASAIGACLLGKRKTHLGLTFEFTD